MLFALLPVKIVVNTTGNFCCKKLHKNHFLKQELTTFVAINLFTINLYGREDFTS